MCSKPNRGVWHIHREYAECGTKSGVAEGGIKIKLGYFVEYSSFLLAFRERYVKIYQKKFPKGDSMNTVKINELLRQKADLYARVNLLPYEGTPEIKENKSGKYLYVRRREAGKLKSIYVGTFNDELYAALLRYSKEGRELRRLIRKTEKELALLGYEDGELSGTVLLNLDFARANMKSNIYDKPYSKALLPPFRRLKPL